MTLRPIDKKVVDSFLDRQATDGNILTTDGHTLETTGYLGSGAVIAIWHDDKVSILDEYSSRTEQMAANYVRKVVPSNMQQSHDLGQYTHFPDKHSGQFVQPGSTHTARKKKKAQDERQPGQVSATLRRRMGDALAEIFDQYGPEIYSDIVITLKDNILERFKNGFDDLEATVKDELGRRGVDESRHHIRAWANEIVEDVNHFGLDEVAGALEDYVGTLTAEYMQPEEGEDILEVPDAELEGVEEVSEEEVEPMEEVPEEEALEIELPEEEAAEEEETA